MRTLLTAIGALMELKSTLIAIDGPCGAGKSTLARRLQEFFVDAEVYHMDDFFLPPDMRTKERLAMPGGNVYHERFLEQVLNPLQTGKPFTYQVYNCQTDSLRAVQAEPARLAIVEGSYSLHPTLRAHYDLKVFVDVTPQEQERRIRARNSADMVPRFLNEWIPMENAYFRQENLREIADLLIQG